MNLNQKKLKLISQSLTVFN